MRPLRREPAAVLQLNIGLYCNQACSHCHVDSSPLRTEMMDRRTAQRCLELLAASRDTVRTLDLTGGAPELNGQFRWRPMPPWCGNHTAHMTSGGGRQLCGMQQRHGQMLGSGNRLSST